MAELKQPFAIITVELCKRFDHFVALHRLTLNVTRGCIFGLLGPNGAGGRLAVVGSPALSS